MDAFHRGLLESRKRPRPDELSIAEQALYVELSRRYDPGERVSVPSNFSGENARETLVALLMREREAKSEEHHALELQLTATATELKASVERVAQLERSLETLAPIAKILEENALLKDFVFKQKQETALLKARAEEREAFAKAELDKFRVERQKRTDAALRAVNEEHWRFLDDVVSSLGRDTRDAFIAFMERVRMIWLQS